MTVGTNKKNSY